MIVGCFLGVFFCKAFKIEEFFGAYGDKISLARFFQKQLILELSVSSFGRSIRSLSRGIYMNIFKFSKLSTKFEKFRA